MRASLLWVPAVLAAIAACSGASSSLGGNQTCSVGGLCGTSTMQVCITQDSNGVCTGVEYKTGAGSFKCNTCADCAQAATSAANACGGTFQLDGGSSSSGSGSSGGSGSSSGGNTTCANGATCADGLPMQVCTTLGSNGACASIAYTVGSQTFTCSGCKNCSAVQSEASQACAGGSSSSSGGSSGSGSGSGSSSSSGGGSGSGSGSGSSSGGSSGSSSGGVDAGPTDQTCHAQASTQCITCCQQIHMAGVQALLSEIKACDCGTNAPCQTACATEFCSNGTITTVGDACDTCINNSLTPDAGGACLTPVETQCNANAGCVAYLTCANACP